MNFKEYEEKAITTKCYADEVAVPYVVLGLCGEVGEFIEKVRTKSSVDLVFKECGDILWYCAAIRIEMDLDPIEWPNSYAEEMFDSVDPAEYAGQVAEQTKKWLRDDWNGVGTEVPEERKQKIHTYLTNLLQLLHNWLEEANAGITLQEIAQQNIEKLADRARRGVINGSGDLR